MRIGILGLGSAGTRHLAAFRKMPGVNVCAADVDAARRRRAEAEGVPAVAGLDDLLATGPRAVVVAVPHAYLAAAGMRVLEAGCDLLLEKPMAVRLDDAVELVGRARRAGRRVMVSFVHRFRPEVAAAREVIRRGEIGRPALVIDTMASGASEMPAWVWRRDLAGGGMMFYNGIHQVDRVRFLLDDEIDHVRAETRTLGHEADVEDTVTSLIGFRSGALGVVVQHKAPSDALGGWDTHVFGSKGSLHISTGHELRWTAGGRTRSAPGAPEDRFLAAATEFVTALREDRAPSPTGEDGLAALRIVLCMYADSAESASHRAVDAMPTAQAQTQGRPFDGPALG
jgi:UDP-N-acetyl-2-amino-2-deoxyglucuronate dehydrogenase